MAELRVGNCSPATSEMFRGCINRILPIDDGIEATKLYATRREVAHENQERMDELKTEPHEFTANDTGEVHHYITLHYTHILILH